MLKEDKYTHQNVFILLKNNLDGVKTYVGEDGKLHFTDGTGADSVLNFSGGVKISAIRAHNGGIGVVKLEIKENSKITYTLSSGARLIITDASTNTTIHSNTIASTKTVELGTTTSISIEVQNNAGSNTIRGITGVTIE